MTNNRERVTSINPSVSFSPAMYATHTQAHTHTHGAHTTQADSHTHATHVMYAPDQCTPDRERGEIGGGKGGGHTHSFAFVDPKTRPHHAIIDTRRNTDRPDLCPSVRPSVLSHKGRVLMKLSWRGIMMHTSGCL
mmetsp:Transcript_17617/g.50030  ORF Transcript_17617/g.50030 Transcript_17617/m.50030 type:complete len:135 (+) Transcript_17617:1878-2282(+)